MFTFSVTPAKRKQMRTHNRVDRRLSQGSNGGQTFSATENGFPKLANIQQFNALVAMLSTFAYILVQLTNSYYINKMLYQETHPLK